MPLWLFLPFLRALICLSLKCGSHSILFSAHRSFYHQDHLVWLQWTTCMAICGGPTPYRLLFDFIYLYGLNYLVSTHTRYSYVSRSCPGIYLAFRCIYPDICWIFIARCPTDTTVSISLQILFIFYPKWSSFLWYMLFHLLLPIANWGNLLFSLLSPYPWLPHFQTPCLGDFFPY